MNLKTRKEDWHPSRWNLKFYAVVAGLLAALNLLGPHGFVHWVLLKQETIRLGTRSEVLTHEIRDLKASIRRFRSSKIARERAIREELGYLKPDEFSVEVSE